MSAALRRLHRVLTDASRGFGHIESDDGYEPEVQDVGPIGAVDGCEPFASAFRLVLIEPRVGRREFTVTISESTTRR